MDHFWLAIIWIIYFIIHSALAFIPLKNYFYSIGIKPQSYRLVYVIIAIIALIPIFMLEITIDSDYLFAPNNYAKIGGLVLAGWGFIIAKIAFKSYDTKAFLGLGSLEPENEFTTKGLLKKVRHPLYSGSILMVIGYFLFNPKWSVLISVSMIILYFVVGIKLEEKKLINVFGEKYKVYRKKTPMLIPRFWKNS